MISRQEARKLRAMIEKASASLDDTDALEAVELFPAWAENVDYVAQKSRCRDDGRLYKCRQTHRSQSDWRPSITPALWEEVAKPGEGDSPDNPIAYNNNMKLFEGKYYSQSGVVYRCFRSTGIPVNNNLADLVGIYVEVVK